MAEREEVTFDHSELREMIRRRFGTEEEFAKRMQLSRRAVSMKLNNHWDWKRSEIVRACDALGIRECDIVRMFFQRRADMAKKPAFIRNTGESIEIQNGNAKLHIDADGITASVQSKTHPQTEAGGDCRKH